MVKPICSNYIMSRVQVHLVHVQCLIFVWQGFQIDLVDFSSVKDGDFKYICHIQYHFSKFSVLTAVTSKRAEEEVSAVALETFLSFGCPAVIQSDNGREFANQYMKELSSMWPDCKLVHGRPRHPASQGAVEWANKDVCDQLTTWMHDNKTTKWSVGLKFVQWQKNASYHTGYQ